MKEETEDVEEVGKKRVAHPSAATSVTRQLGPSQPPKKLITPQQKMYERWRLMREAAVGKAAEKATADTKTQVTSASAVQSLSNLHKEHIESASISNSDLQSNVNGKLNNVAIKLCFIWTNIFFINILCVLCNVICVMSIV